MSKRTLYAHFRTKNDLVIAHLRGLALSGALEVGDDPRGHPSA